MLFVSLCCVCIHRHIDMCVLYMCCVCPCATCVYRDTRVLCMSPHRLTHACVLVSVSVSVSVSVPAFVYVCGRDMPYN